MKKNSLFIISLFASVLVAPLQAQKKGLKSINQHDLKQHMLFLSSDELKGRDTGEPGLEVAARYLAVQAEALGLKSADPKKSRTPTMHHCSRELLMPQFGMALHHHCLGTV